MAGDRKDETVGPNEKFTGPKISRTNYSKLA